MERSSELYGTPYERFLLLISHRFMNHHYHRVNESLE